MKVIQTLTHFFCEVGGEKFTTRPNTTKTEYKTLAKAGKPRNYEFLSGESKNKILYSYLLHNRQQVGAIV